MKKLLLFAVVALICSTTISNDVLGQMAKKYALMEHFTNASCPPCAEQNPFFEEFYNTRGASVHHIAYHTSWPGVDPMYDDNATEVDTKVSYYGVQGVPTVIADGTVDVQPASVDDALINQVSQDGSAVRLEVSETTEGTTRTVKINVITVADVPMGNWRLRTAVVERDVNYDSPPGTNGEAYFLNVFRETLAGTSGEAYEAAGTGEMATYNYSYEIDESWDPEQVYVIAFLQDPGTKAVLNSGSSRDLPLSFVNSTATFQQVEAGSEAAFLGLLNIFGESNELLSLKVTNEGAPESWKTLISLPIADLEIGETSFEFEAGLADAILGIKIQTDDQVALAKYVFEIGSASNPESPTFKYNYYVNTGVTDLVVSHSAAAEYVADYSTGLESAAKGEVSLGTYLDANDKNALKGLKNMYMNVGWSFPSITEDMVFSLSSFLDNGGNLLIAGQDIGWDNSGAEGSNGTSMTMSFYSQYLNATYVDDGGTANSVLSPIADGEVYGALGETGIARTYGTNFYPDQIEPKNSAVSIFTYNGDASRIAGIASDNDTGSKVVYLGTGVEMFEDEAVKSEFMKVTEAWFNSGADAVGVNDYQAAINRLMQNQPNPANNLTIINMETVNSDATLKVMDMTGKVVLEQAVQSGTNQVKINTTDLSEGTYIYQLTNAEGVSTTKKMTVLH